MYRLHKKFYYQFLYVYIKNEKTLFDLRAGREAIVVPADGKEDLLKAIDHLEKAIKYLESMQPLATKTNGQLKQVVANLKRLSEGSNDGYAYDLDMVHQRIAHAFKNAIAWSQEQPL